MNAFWNRWHKRLAHESVPSRAAQADGVLGPLLLDELRTALAPVTRPCAAISLGGPATSPVQSYLTGHPYLPAGATWPQGPDGPQLFVGQINFAEIGVLPGFPSAGLLQWFVDPGDTWGLTFDRDAGRTGFSVRWYPDPAAASPDPDDPTPNGHLDDLPMEFVGPTAVEFRPAASVPGWKELPDELRTHPVLERVALALGESRSDPEFLYSEYVRGDTSPLPELRAASKIGGYPSFTLDDPRGTGGYPAIGSGASELIIELDSVDVGGWGDSGIAHLFGDPRSLARGDVDGIRYHWDCL